MSARADRITRLLALARLFNAPFFRAYHAGDVEGMDRALDRSRAVSAALADEAVRVDHGDLAATCDQGVISARED